MELNQLQALSDAQKARYMAMGRLFEHPSYKFLMEWAKSSVEEAEKRELNAPTWDLVLVNRGARLAFLDVLNLETQVENEFTALAEQSIEADEQKQETQMEADGV